MAEKYEPPVTDALMALFASAAPLFEKAKAAGLFRGWPAAPTPAGASGASASSASSSAESEASPDTAQKTALQDIIVAQAMKIVALEAEVARLKS